MVAALNLLASFSLAVPIVVGESIALFARQLDPGFTPNDIPESCVATCQTYSQTLTSGSCTTLSCLCTDAIASGIDACLSCAVDANIPDFNKTVADQTINGYIEGCNEAGFPVSISGFSDTASTTTTAAIGGASSTKSGSTGTATSTLSPGNIISSKSAATREHSLSMVGTVFAVAIAGLALL